ncbi:hypothetical protein LguiA_018943 [Lonicera macranthoides]
MAISELLKTNISMLSGSILDTSTVVAITVFVTLLCACIVIGHLLEEHRWANESITALLLFPSQEEAVFQEFLNNIVVWNIWHYNIILPHFTRCDGQSTEYAEICARTQKAERALERAERQRVMKAVIGVTSLNIQGHLAIGAILSATDSVCTLQVLNQEETPFLYSVVFGEGVVNDATSIVLFNAVQSLDVSNIDAFTALKLLWTFLYLFFTSTFLGIAGIYHDLMFPDAATSQVGLLSAFGIKTLYFGRHSTDREVAIMMLMAYLSYMVAELLSLSGILTVFFCGIVMSHYTWHNVTESSRITTRHAFATISFIAETFIFLYVGMDALDIDKWKETSASAGTSIAVSAILFGLVLIGRAAFVYPLATLSNCLKRRDSDKIVFREQVFGSVTKPLINAVMLRNTKTTSDATDFASLEDLRLAFLENGGTSEPRGTPSGPTSSFRLLIKYPTYTAHQLWRKFDDKFMRPVFGGQGFVPYARDSTTGAENANDAANETDN